MQATKPISTDTKQYEVRPEVKSFISVLFFTLEIAAVHILKVYTKEETVVVHTVVVDEISIDGNTDRQ